MNDEIDYSTFVLLPKACNPKPGMLKEISAGSVEVIKDEKVEEGGSFSESVLDMEESVEFNFGPVSHDSFDSHDFSQDSPMHLRASSTSVMSDMSEVSSNFSNFDAEIFDFSDSCSNAFLQSRNQIIPQDAIHRTSSEIDQLLQINLLAQRLSLDCSFIPHVNTPQNANFPLPMDLVNHANMLGQTRLSRTQSADLSSGRTKRQIKHQIRRQMKEQMKHMKKTSILEQIGRSSTEGSAYRNSVDRFDTKDDFQRHSFSRLQPV